MDRYCLPATTIHAISHMTFPAFDFSIVSYYGSFFNFKTTKQTNELSVHLYGTELEERSTLTLLPVTSHSETDTSHWQDGGEWRKHLLM